MVAWKSQDICTLLLSCYLPSNTRCNVVVSKCLKRLKFCLNFRQYIANKHFLSGEISKQIQRWDSEIHFYETNIKRCDVWYVAFVRLSRTFNDHARHLIAAPFFGHKLPAARARELLKPSTDSASLLVDVKFNVYHFGLRFSGGNVTSRGVFVLFWPSLPGPGRCPNGPFLDSKVSWKLGQNPRL